MNTESLVKEWIENIIIGLNLCPFAKYPYNNHQVRIFVCKANDDIGILTDLHTELSRLSETPASETETTLLVIENHLSDFSDFNQFLDQVDQVVDKYEWSGEFQIATFHPHYQFADTHPDDAENLTNRAPFPILHLIREDSLSQAIKHYPDPENIPSRNIELMNTMDMAELKRLFHYLF